MGGSGGFYTSNSTGGSCPTEAEVRIEDVFQSGNNNTWDTEIEDGEFLDLSLDGKDRTIIVSFEGVTIGRIRNSTIYNCIANGVTYTCVVWKKKMNLCRLVKE